MAKISVGDRFRIKAEGDPLFLLGKNGMELEIKTLNAREGNVQSVMQTRDVIAGFFFIENGLQGVSPLEQLLARCDGGRF